MIARWFVWMSKYLLSELRHEKEVYKQEAGAGDPGM